MRTIRPRQKLSGGPLGLRAACHQPLLFSKLPASLPFALTGILTVALMPLCTLRSVPEPAPPRPVVQIETRIQAEGCDKNQRRLPFTVYILSQELSWKFESTTDLDCDRPLLNPELEAALNRATDVFCIGTASAEGATEKEEARAGQRAGTLAQWLRGMIRASAKTRVFTLNAGQYKGPGDLESVNQRKAIIIATESHADDVNLGEALSSGLQKKELEYPVVHNLLHYYSRSADWLRFSGIATSH